MERVSTELTYRQQEEILQSKLHELSSQGWEITSTSATSASVALRATRRSFGANLIATIFTLGLWLFVWALMVIINPFPRDRHAHVSVDSHGVVKTSTAGILSAKVTEDRHWAVEAAHEAGEYEPQYPAQDSLFNQTEPIDELAPERSESTTSTLLFGSQEYRDTAARRVIVGMRGNLYLLEDRLEFYKGKTLQWSHPKEGVSAPETKRFGKFVIYGADGETLLETDSVTRSEQRKVREYLAES